MSEAYMRHLRTCLWFALGFALTCLVLILASRSLAGTGPRQRGPNAAFVYPGAGADLHR